MTVTIVNKPLIARNTTLSDTLDCSAMTLRIIIFPAAWSGGVLTFQASVDGTTFYDLYRSPTGELVQLNVTPGGLIVLQMGIWTRLFFKFRSGTPKVPTNQDQNRVFTCVLE